jgi:hypothetical protein
METITNITNTVTAKVNVIVDEAPGFLSLVITLTIMVLLIS